MNACWLGSLFCLLWTMKAKCNTLLVGSDTTLTAALLKKLLQRWLCSDTDKTRCPQKTLCFISRLSLTIILATSKIRLSDDRWSHPSFLLTPIYGWLTGRSFDDIISIPARLLQTSKRIFYRSGSLKVDILYLCSSLSAIVSVFRQGAWFNLCVGASLTQYRVLE